MIRRSTRVKNPTIKKKEMDLTDAILYFWRIEKSFKSKLNDVITISNIESLKTSVHDSYDEVRRYTSIFFFGWKILHYTNIYMIG